MTNGDINRLIEQLNNIRVEREEAVRIIGQTDRQEAEIIANLQALQQTRRRRKPTNVNANHAPNDFCIGQIVEITNRLRDKCGTTGEVISIGHTKIEIRNTTTRNKYSRAYWNLRLVPQNENAQ